ncbi:MAG: copper chaperone PCu(A)C [Methyloceanibacter sp.]|jgi:copper(I)-binding protein
MTSTQDPESRRIAAALALFGAAVLVGLTGQVALAGEFRAGAISVEQPWSRATPGGAKVAAGYLTIKNDAATPDRLVSAKVEVAGRAEIHEMSMSDGVMRMRPLPEGLVVPANGSVALAPGSSHLMLLDLKRPLQDGETFSGTVTFEKAGTLDVIFDVRGMGAKAPEANEHQHH